MIFHLSALSSGSWKFNCERNSWSNCFDSNVSLWTRADKVSSNPLTIIHILTLSFRRLAVDVGGSSILKDRIYTGTFDCLKKTFHREGARGVYSGFAVALGGEYSVMVFQLYLVFWCQEPLFSEPFSWEVMIVVSIWWILNIVYSGELSLLRSLNVDYLQLLLN